MPAPELIRAMRPRQWLKNAFVLAPAVFSGHAFDPVALARVTWAAAAFCLASSAGYLLNDVIDRDADRRHPIKRLRPIAAGRVRPGPALALAGALAVAALALALWLSADVALALAGYLLVTMSYSLGLKKVALVEALVLAAGFVVRLVAGALAIGVVASHWLLVCGFLLALLLAFGKREPAEGENGLYPAAFLRDATTVLAAVTVLAYTLYTVAPETVARVGSHSLLATVPLVLLGVLRYLLLLRTAGAQDPSAALLADRPLLLTVVGWAALSALLLARGGGPPA